MNLCTPEEGQRMAQPKELHQLAEQMLEWSLQNSRMDLKSKERD